MARKYTLELLTTEERADLEREFEERLLNNFYLEAIRKLESDPSWSRAKIHEVNETRGSVRQVRNICRLEGFTCRTFGELKETDYGLYEWLLDAVVLIRKGLKLTI